MTNHNSGTVSVINGADNSVTPVTMGLVPNGVAVNAATNKIYVANGLNSGTVSVINGADNSVTSVSVGSSPFDVAVNAATNKIYVANNASGTVSVINGADNSVTPVTVGSNPAAVAVNAATNKIYVANNGSGSVSVITDATDDGLAFQLGTGSDNVNANTNAARDSVNANTNAAVGGIPANVNANTNAARDAVNAHTDSATGIARDAVNAHTDSALSIAGGKIDQVSSRVGPTGVGFNTDAFCAEGSARPGLQMYVTVFSKTAQTVHVSYITNKGTFGHDVALSPGVRYTDDANGFLVHPGGVLAGQDDVDTSVEVSGPNPLFLACPVYFVRSIGDAGLVSGGTVQDGSHN